MTVLVLVVIAAGCGGDDDNTSAPPDPRENVIQAVHRFQEATLDRDASGYCDALTGDGKRDLVVRLAPLGNFDCEQAAAKVLDLAGADDFARVQRAHDLLRPSDIQINGKRAVATLASKRQLDLERSQVGWLVDNPDAHR